MALRLTQLNDTNRAAFEALLSRHRLAAPGGKR